MALAIVALVGFSTFTQPTDDPVMVAAIEANVDPAQLTAALLTVGESDPREYLHHTGELRRPVPDRSPVIWDRLAACESTSRWHINSGNGYYGGLQADMTFWRRHGGLAFAARPDLATREQQIIVAQRGQAVQGWGAWPACSRRLGLR